VTDHLAVLESSVERLRQLVTPLTDEQLVSPAYPSEWSIADVLSHVGSGAVILQRRLDDALVGQPTPDDFAPSVWATWNAKSPQAKATDGLAADGKLVRRIAGLTAEEQANFEFAMGPMKFDLAGFVGLRLNEHALHTWDIEVALYPAAVVPGDAVALIVDNLELIGRFTAKPTGRAGSISVRTTEPGRDFGIVLEVDKVTFSPGGRGGDSELVLPAEAFIRLVYGRLDPEHTPTIGGNPEILDDLRRVFPGP
jgi:uncharacterized protein (TIGR03083 family)